LARREGQPTFRRPDQILSDRAFFIDKFRCPKTVQIHKHNCLLPKKWFCGKIKKVKKLTKANHGCGIRCFNDISGAD